MYIVYYDGGVLECHSILVSDKELIVDNIYSVPIVEVQRIVETKGELP